MELLIEILCFCSIIIAGLILRLIPHIKYYFPGTQDTFFFLNKIKNPDYRSDEIVYPKLFIQLLRFFINEKMIVDGLLINRVSVVIDSITATFLYIFVRNIYSVEIALLSSLLFMITPFVVKQGTSLSARSFGLLLVSTSLLFITLPYPWTWLAIIPMAMTLLTHRLSAQSLFVIFVGLSIFDIQYSLYFITGFILAILGSKGEYITILRAHLSAVAHYVRRKGYPNKRIIGILSTPTFFGFLAYLLLFIIQVFGSLPIVIGDFEFPELVHLDILFESIMLIWASSCFLLLVFWIAGESYKHLSIAAIPFAFLTSLFAFSDSVFFILALILIIGAILESLYFQLRFEHIDTELGALLNHSSLKDDTGVMFISHRFARAGAFFASCRVVGVYLFEWTKDDFERRVLEENPTIAIADSDDRHWYSEWKEVAVSGRWTLFRVK